LVQPVAGRRTIANIGHELLSTRNHLKPVIGQPSLGLAVE
jgi:hypothetical protein